MASNTTNTSTQSPLKAAALMEQMKLHLGTDAGKALLKKIGLVYQLNIAPKVSLFSYLSTWLFSVVFIFVSHVGFFVLCFC